MTVLDQLTYGRLRSRPEWWFVEGRHGTVRLPEALRALILTMMNATNPIIKLQQLAEHALACEARLGGSDFKADLPPGFRVLEKIRTSLTIVVGNSVFYSLQARALKLGSALAPQLSKVRIVDGGEWAGLNELGDADEAKKASTILITQLLGLLALFVGEELLYCLLHDVLLKDASR